MATLSIPDPIEPARTLRSVTEADSVDVGIAARISVLSGLVSDGSSDQQEALHHALDLILQLVPVADSALLIRRTRAGLRGVGRFTGDPGALDMAQQHAGQGPAFDALEQDTMVIVSSWTTETRWPQLRQLVAGLAGEISEVPAIVCIPLASGGHPGRCLMLGSPEPGAFDAIPPVLSVAAAAMTLLMTALERSALAHHLGQALDSNRRIGTAMGVLMAGSQCSEDEAFTALRQTSQRTHVKIRQLADEVIYTGTLPADTPPGRRAPALAS